MAGSRIQDIIMYDTRANQPDAADVSIGTLYYVTDENITERSNGTTWDDFSDAALGGINQLTGDITAGPGTGSQAATIATASVTNAKMADMAQSTIKGRAVGAGTGVPTDLTATQATAILNNLVGDSGAGGTKGLAPAPAAGDAAADKFLHADGTWQIPAGSGNVRTVGITIDGGGAVPDTGVHGYVRVPFTCTISRWTLLADQAGDAVVDIWKDTFANYPPVNADSITAAAPPTLSGADHDDDTTLTGWTTAITAGDVLGFNLDSITDITRLTLILDLTV